MLISQTLKDNRLDVRAPYNSPEFRVYGDFARLTQTNRSGVVADCVSGKGSSCASGPNKS
jgi:hypothetical protein